MDTMFQDGTLIIQIKVALWAHTLKRFFGSGFLGTQSMRIKVLIWLSWADFLLDPHTHNDLDVMFIHLTAFCNGCVWEKSFWACKRHMTCSPYCGHYGKSHHIAQYRLPGAG